MSLIIRTKYMFLDEGGDKGLREPRVFVGFGFFDKSKIAKVFLKARATSAGNPAQKKSIMPAMQLSP